LVSGGWRSRPHGTDAGFWVLPAMLVLGALGGALYALIPALFKVRFGASEILTSLMLVLCRGAACSTIWCAGRARSKGFNFPTRPIRLRRRDARS